MLGGTPRRPPAQNVLTTGGRCGQQAGQASAAVLAAARNRIAASKREREAILARIA